MHCFSWYTFLFLAVEIPLPMISIICMYHGRKESMSPILMRDDISDPKI